MCCIVHFGLATRSAGSALEKLCNHEQLLLQKQQLITFACFSAGRNSTKVYLCLIWQLLVGNIS